MTSLQQFEKHNQEIKNNLIDGKPVETYYTIDPNDPIFNQPLSAKNYGKDETI